MPASSPDLPREIADRFTKPFARFVRIQAAAGVLLLFATLTALTLANSPFSEPFLSFWETSVGFHLGSLDFSRSLRHWINDGLMTFFFFVIALELKRELLLGELRDPRVAALPFAGALGGMIVPACVYLALMIGQPGAHGWGTVMATDTAFALGCLALFGHGIWPSLRLFLLSLAIFDDVGAILIVAISYGEALNWTALGLAALGLATVAGAARLGIRSVPIYFLLGAVIWICFDASGIHATVTGVILGLMTPTLVWVSDVRLRAAFERVLSYPEGGYWSGNTTERRDLQQAGVAATEALSPLERLEMMLHPWVAFAVLPTFALANAGVTFAGADVREPVIVAIFVGLVFGKPAGVLAFTWFSVRLGLATKPPSLNWILLAAGACLTGIGFTMSLFIAGLAYAPGLLQAAKIGILSASAVSAVTGLLVLGVLPIRST
jgi:NhaA family Na+:H+ antiporter